ncbi:MAG TPA: DUF3089 domain-containing protein [Solirubrobacteraceae bacterium]|jgi:hypothetical protein|nr:DUF3089 domain-containing protein [Solirubrobacteraceae bacterium]
MLKQSTWSAVAVAVFAAGALCAWATAPTTASASTAWLCAPGIAHDPCVSSEKTTVELANGTSYVERARPGKAPPIDCFYVYGTVSGQTTENANLEIGPEETQVAVSQPSRFSQACKVYAPIYPQLTAAAISANGGVTLQGIATAYFGVVAAFDEYLADYNDGRPFVLIGDSQGAAILAELIREQIDPNPLLRAKLVSAILLGGNLIVPEGKTVGGSFEHIPTCQSELQTGCLIAFSSFLGEPPKESYFGRPTNALISNAEVVCVNPTVPVQDGRAGTAFSYYPTEPFPGPLEPFVQVPTAATPWVATPREYSAQCEKANGASWLQLTRISPADPREALLETLGPRWGTHLDDFNIVMGNLVATVRLQASSYLVTH